MDKLSRLNLDGFNPEMSFQITLDNYKDKDDNNESPSIDLISNDLKVRLKKDISESVMNLTQCFICLSIAEYPLSCPKCNNFACKDCLEKYFGEEEEKKCPLCNQKIRKVDLKKNKTIREIEKIIYKEDTKNNKIQELTKIVNMKKKKLWENQEQYLNNLINNVVQYQESMREYRKKYELYIIKWKQQIDKVFSQYEKKIENLIDLLLKYKQKYGKDLSESIKSTNKKSINVDNFKIKDKIFNLKRPLLTTMKYRKSLISLKKYIPKDSKIFNCYKTKYYNKMKTLTNESKIISKNLSN